MTAQQQSAVPAWRRWIDRPAVLLGVAGAVLLAMAALPVYRGRDERSLVAVDAQSSYQTLRSRLEQGVLPAARTTDPAAPDTLAEGGARRLERDLFLPQAHQPRPRTAGGEPDSPPEPTEVLPGLAGIFLDGPKARAVIDGQTVSEGDYVAGFCIVRIYRESVVLRRGDRIEELRLKGGK